MSEIKILLADDQKLFVQSIETMLQNTPGFKVEKTVHSGEELMRAIHRPGLDILLLDVELTKGSTLEQEVDSGLDLAEKIRVKKPNLKIMFLSMFADRESIVTRALAKPIEADGICSKDVTGEKLAEMIRKICIEKTSVYSEDVVNLIVKTSGEKDKLSGREKKIACLTARGKGVKDIGRELHLGVKTIESHKTIIYRKLGISGNSELTAYVIKERICDGLFSE